MTRKMTSTNIIRAVLFDFDGTLTEPGSLDFHAIRQAIGCPGGVPVLEFIHSMNSPEERLSALRILDAFESEAASLSVPNQGAEELLEWLPRRGLRTGIISRNSRSAIRSALKNFKRIHESDFAVILSRDDPFYPKPSPAGILAAASMMAVSQAEVLVVGDYVFDIEAGRRAGTLTAFLTNRRVGVSSDCSSDFTVEQLTDLKGILDIHAPLPPGKLPNEMLGRILGEFRSTDPSLVVPPGVGQDAAVLALSGEELLALKADPITFATDSIGWYSVTVNVNDMAAVGATARWLLATLLCPVGTNALRIASIMKELNDKARAEGLILCGGHTEITDAVTRPVISLHVAGTAHRNAIVNKNRVAEGDLVLMTKRLAVEGTSLVARELPGRLRDAGLDDAFIERCRGFLRDPGISVVRDATIAAAVGGVSAMHDITEGGLATALHELSTAGGHRIRVHMDQIPIYPETEIICRHLQLDPLGLIASGSLLISCHPGKVQEVVSALSAEAIEASCLGKVLDRGVGVLAVSADGSPVPWPLFQVDEIARLFASLKRS